MKRQASDAGESVKSSAKTVKKQVESEGQTVVDKVFHVLYDLKDSVFGTHRNSFDVLSSYALFLVETLGFASKHAAALTDQAKEKFDEVSGNAKKAKKAAKDTLDL